MQEYKTIDRELKQKLASRLLAGLLANSHIAEQYNMFDRSRYYNHLLDDANSLADRIIQES